MLSEDAIKRYIESQGNQCPYCDSHNIESGDIDWDSPLGIEVTCNRCDKRWIDIMSITGISEISD